MEEWRAWGTEVEEALAGGGVATEYDPVMQKLDMLVYE